MNLFDNISLARALTTLPIMLKGMLGIFAVIFVIFLIIKLLNQFFPAKSGNDEQQK